ncbi:MAG TPA: universal stress protein [Acidimicrobiales bacterium]|nr:universal stress protein [Acidimicrobiales bacterium]
MAGAAPVWPAVVVGTDGSERASGAVEHAARLAAATRAQLWVVVAYRRKPSQPGVTGVDRVPDDVSWMVTDRGDAEGVAARAAAVASAAGAPDVHHCAGEGDPAEVLLEVAGRHPGSLVVVGSKGMTGAGRFVLGSVPNNLSHHAAGDVLIVHTG